MIDVVIAGIFLVTVTLAIRYVVKARKTGQKCIGCPNGSCSGSCGCCGGEKKPE